MARKPKNKMSASERAKQFMPFSALSGLEDAIMKKIGEIANQTGKTTKETNINEEINF